MSQYRLSAPVRSAIRDPKFRELVRQAGTILGVDARTGRESLFAQAGRAGAAPVLRVPLDLDTNDAEALAALCTSLKGSCCYPARATA